MKKHNLFPLLAVLLLAMGFANAQISSQSVKADIPFAFMAGSANLPAGEYRLASITDLGTISVLGEPGRTMVNSHVVQAGSASKATKLIFHRYGDHYFLYQIWVQGENRGREFPETRLEKELASNAGYDIVAVLARR